MRQDVKFESEGVELSGWIYTLDSQPLWPIVVMAHGYSMTRRRTTADKYAEVFQAVHAAANPLTRLPQSQQLVNST